MVASIIAKTKKENLVFLAGMLLFLLLLSRYLVNGEPVDVRSDVSGVFRENVEDVSESAGVGVMLSDGMEISQPMTIPADVNWRQGYYALFFSKSNGESAGELVCTLTQGDWQSVQRIPVTEITAGEWTVLDQLPLQKLESGTAVLSLHTEGVTEDALEIAAGQDFYGFSNFSLNGTVQEAALAQAYHYHMTGPEYRGRLACYGIILLCTACLLFLVYGDGKCMESESAGRGYARLSFPHLKAGDGKGKEPESAGYGVRGNERKQFGEKGRCLAAFGILTVMFMAVIYVLDSSIYLEPTYAEAVTNFLRYAREEKLTANLLIADAGYLPLLPRLITLFYVKLLRVPSSCALYFMQVTACLLCSMVWAFFVLPPFRGLMRFPNRILWCILVMMTCFCEETLLFTNHAYWGIYLLLLLLAAELSEFPGWIYAILLGAAALICLSKGTYAVMLPLMAAYLLFFWKSIGRRDRLYAGVTGAAAMLQLLYSFSGQGDGGGWIDMVAMGQPAYWLRLFGRLAVEFGASLLTPFRTILQRVSGSGIVPAAVASVFLVILAWTFIARILLPVCHGKRIGRQQVVFYTMALFLLIVSVFFLVTVKRVPDSWAAVGRMEAAQMGSKYEIFSNMGFYMLLLAGGALVRKRSGMSLSYGVLLLLLIFFLTDPAMRLTGWADAVVSDGRVYAGDINTGWQDGKHMISESSFFLPVRGDNWAYSRNCNVYQVGTETYFEETSCINLEEKLAGYHNSYTIRNEAQAQNLIEVMIERPKRVDRPDCRVQLLDVEGNVLAEAQQMDSGRYKKCLFRFAQPVSGVKTIRFIDDAGNPLYYKDYIAWICAW